MGNRAVITTKENYYNAGVGVYVHWNGGIDDVSTFLDYAEVIGVRAPSIDCYGWARLCQIIGNFFGGALSVGIDTIDNLDTKGDNGVYIIEGWKIVKQIMCDGTVVPIPDVRLDMDGRMDAVRDLDSLQPKRFLDTPEKVSQAREKLEKKYGQ